MMVGVTTHKGFHIFCEISNNFPQLEFHAIGDRSLINGKTKNINRVTVHGWPPDPIPFMDQMDVVLVPSTIEEAFGRIAVEALYRNKFVFVSGQGGLPEAVSEQDKLIINSNNTQEWVDRIESLLENPNDYIKNLNIATKLGKRFELKYQINYFYNFLNSLIK